MEGLCRKLGGGGQGPFWLSEAVVSEHALQFPSHRVGLILISNFRRVLNAVLCLLGNLPASELLVPTFSSETSELKAQMPGDYPKDTIRQKTVLFIHITCCKINFCNYYKGAPIIN